QGVRDAEGEQQRRGDPDLCADARRQPAVRDQRRRDRVNQEEEIRDPQPAADVGVHARAARDQRDRQQHRPDHYLSHSYALVTRTTSATVVIRKTRIWSRSPMSAVDVATGAGGLLGGETAIAIDSLTLPAD